MCVRVHEYGLVMEYRTTNPSTSVAVSLANLATATSLSWPFYVKHLVVLSYMCVKHAPCALTSASHCVQTS